MAEAIGGCFSQERGIKHFKEVEEEQRGKSSKTIPGDTAFFLYDSMGFPLDLTQVMAEEVRMPRSNIPVTPKGARRKAKRHLSVERGSKLA